MRLRFRPHLPLIQWRWRALLMVGAFLPLLTLSLPPVVDASPPPSAVWVNLPADQTSPPPSLTSLWGIAVSSTGDLFVASNQENGASHVIEELPAGSSTWTDLTENAANLWTYPTGIAVGSTGNLYVVVADGANEGVWELPVGTQTWTQLTTSGPGFSGPEGLAVNQAGDLFVTNTNATPGQLAAVMELPAGSNQWIDITDGYGTFDNPSAIAVDNTTGTLFVTNRGNNTIVALAKGSDHWQSITDGGPFNQPVGIAVDSTGNVYVTNGNDSTSDSVVELAAGTDTWQDISDGAMFLAPTGIAVSSTGVLYVTNREGPADVDAIVERTPAPALTGVQIAPGTSMNTTQVVATEPDALSGTYAVQVTATAPSGTVVGMPLPTGATAYTLGQSIPAQAGDVLTLYEVTAAGLVEGASTWTLTSADVPPLASLNTLQPTQGPPGSRVTIQGTNFGSTTGAVYWTQGTQTTTSTGAAILNWSPTSVTTTVPTSLVPGSVAAAVYNPITGSLSNHQAFTVLAPTDLNTIEPISGLPGSPVTIQGTNFGSTSGAVYWTQGAHTITSTRSAILNWSPTSVMTTVPDSLTPGAVTAAVYNQTTGILSAPQGFTVLAFPVVLPPNPTPTPTPPVTPSPLPLPPSTKTRLVLAGENHGSLDVSLPNRSSVDVLMPNPVQQAVSIQVRYFAGVPVALPNLPGYEVFQISVTNPQKPKQRVTWLPGRDRFKVQSPTIWPPGTTLQRWDVSQQRWVVVARARTATAVLQAPLPHMANMTYVVVPPPT